MPEKPGVSLPRNAERGDVLESVFEAVAQQALASGYLMMDPTPVRLKSNRKKGSTKEACLWTYRAPDVSQTVLMAS